ncbi:MAG TPA: 23S rRNA (uracil(1939)-C(5))-methyltransferase RlmD [Solirubrobacteraceae bacterium]|nr:23S rRNA (uracil(1939)-C(5))-methyltransferase RlmD [Solirubrobacteraceae bacterium]
MAAPLSSAQRPAVGDELELRVDSLAFGGAGVARTDGGYVVFVDGAFPGDLVRARVHARKRSYAQARAVAVLEGGPDRVPAEAAHPGAPWQELRYERQLEIKQEQVEDALRRIGRLDGFVLEPIVAAVSPWRYRNKLEYSFGADADGTLVCGLHAPGSWERVVALDDCLLASEASNVAREEVLRFCRERGLTPFDRRTREGFLRNLVVREGRRTGQLLVRLVTSEGQLDSAALAAAVGCHGLLWTRTDARAETTGGRTAVLAGEPHLFEQIGSLELRVSPEAFFQTNTEMAERLYGIVAEEAALLGWERVHDLYCGIGSIGLSLAGRAGSVAGLEIVEDAVRDAEWNARHNEITNAVFYAGDVRLAVAELVAATGRADVLVVDPPRAGLSAKIVRRIIEAAPRRIVYVSCNPTTLAPNAAQLVEAGFSLDRVTPVDMFPQTPHIECVAVLTR